MLKCSKHLWVILLAAVLTASFIGPAAASAEDPRIYVRPFTDQFADEEDARFEAAARYRSGRGTYTGGTRSGVTPGGNTGTGTGTPANRTGARTPADTAGTGTPPAAYRGGGFGGFFGGFATGTLLGSLFNPFGFGGYGYGGAYTGGVSIIGLLFWGVILYAGFKLFRRMRGSSR